MENLMNEVEKYRKIKNEFSNTLKKIKKKKIINQVIPTNVEYNLPYSIPVKGKQFSKPGIYNKATIWLNKNKIELHLPEVQIIENIDTIETLKKVKWDELVEFLKSTSIEDWKVDIIQAVGKSIDKFRISLLSENLFDEISREGEKFYLVGDPKVDVTKIINIENIEEIFSKITGYLHELNNENEKNLGELKNKLKNILVDKKVK